MLSEKSKSQRTAYGTKGDPAYFGIFQSSLLVFLGWFDPKGFPGGSAGKEPACNVRDLG